MKPPILGVINKFLLLIALLLLSNPCYSQSIALSPNTDPPTSKALVSGSGFNWSQFRFSPQHLGVNPYENVLSPSTVSGLNLKWTFQTGDVVGSGPTVVDGVVYMDGWDGNLYALNASTGAKLWAYDSFTLMASDPAVVGGLVYAGTYSSFVALNASTGDLVWSFPRGMVGSPAVLDGVVYVVSGNFGNGDVYALDANTGAELWDYHNGADTLASPAVGNGMVYFGDTNGLHALNANTGALLWSYPAGNLYGTGSPAVTNGVVYIGTCNNLYALDANTGAKLWSYTASDCVSTPAVANGVLYAADGSALSALNASTGDKLWDFTAAVGGNIGPTVANDVVYAGSFGNNHNVYALNANTGALLWSYLTAGTPVWGVTVVDGVVYVNSEIAIGSPGYVQAFGLTGITFTPSSLTFGPQPVGTFSPDQLVTLTNTGSESLHISGINPPGGDFYRINNCPRQLLPNASCTLDVIFTPTATGTRPGQVLVRDNLPDSPQKLPLTGTGTGTGKIRLSISPVALDFGSVAIGTTSSPQSVTVTNIGTATANFSAPLGPFLEEVNYGEFQITSQCGTALAPNSSCQVAVTFAPKASGTRTSSLLVPQGVHTVSAMLNGIGTP